MARTVEQVVGRIDEATAPAFRRQLVAQGLARSLIWRDGELPAGSPNFPGDLTSSLLGYGLSLFQLGLEMRSMAREHEAANRAFERAGEAIESVVRHGTLQWPERGFYTIVAASAYHLGHFSARAFSLLPKELPEPAELDRRGEDTDGTDPGAAAGSGAAIKGLVLGPAQRSLAWLIRRDLPKLREAIFRWTQGGEGFDGALASAVGAQGRDFEDAIASTLNSLFHRGLCLTDYALEAGSDRPINDALRLFQEGKYCAGRLNSVPFWWMFAIAGELVLDLWSQSLHVLLPHPPADQEGAADWARLRQLFIALLFRRKTSEIELWPSQVEAARRAVDKSDDLVAALPTSAGKTRIAEIAILRALSLGKRVVFITPLRALSAQTERTLRRTFQPLGFTVSSLYGSSGSNPGDRDSLKGQDIVVATPEKLDFALRNDAALIDDVGLIVLDEAHTIGAGEREVRYEVLVQRLLRRGDAANRRLVCLSAILPEGEKMDDFVSWVRQDEAGDAIRLRWRPTRQRMGEVVWKGGRGVLQFRVDGERPWVDPFVRAQEARGKRTRPFPQDAKEFTLAIAWRLVEEGHTVLIYCAERRLVEPTAEAVLLLERQGYLQSLLDKDGERFASALAAAEHIGREWLGAFHPAVACLRMGVAVHHGTLPRPFQRAVEGLLREGILKVTIASPTLAQGLNLSATTVLFRSLMRDRRRISGEEFANVAGRAGRAFVDVEGQVLFAAWKPADLRVWNAVLADATNRDLKSGLLTLILTFGERLAREKAVPAESVIEYLLGNAAAWEPPNPGEIQSDEGKKQHEAMEKRWRAELASIDSALLSLLRHDVPLAELAPAIDEALKSSLWERSLRREGEANQAVAKAVLLGRANLLWTNSTPAQRRGYFFAGVGLATGHYLDEHRAELRQFLMTANAALSLGVPEAAFEPLFAFSKLVFAIEPFRPKELLDGWEDLLRAWVSGDSMADLAGGRENKITEFIEQAFVYRLVWAMESVRVQFAEESGSEGDEMRSLAAMAVETGTPTIESAILIQNGLPSRIAAVKALADCPGSFSGARGMRRWLRSDAVIAAQANPDWPTPFTASLWNTFAGAIDDPAMARWSQRAVRFRVDWDGDSPRAGTAVRVIHDEGAAESIVYSEDLARIGELIPPFPLAPAGILAMAADADGESISGTYSGPDDLAQSGPEPYSPF